MRCPVCKRSADIMPSGTVMWHKDGIGKRCKMTGHQYSEEARRELEAA